MKVIAETARLVLRELTLADLDFMAAMLSDAEVMRYYPKVYTRDEAEAWIRRDLDRYARHGHGGWLVLDRAAGHPIGRVGLTMQTVDGVEQPEAGWIIHRPFWRQGYASEAAAATRDYAFQVLGKPRIISLVRPENVPSQGVARKLGMRPEPRTVPHGGFEHLVFVLTRDPPAKV